MNDRVRAELLAERDEAVRVLTAAVAAVDTIEPAAAREPIRLLLRGAAEACERNHHILGAHVVYPLMLARTLLDAGGQHDPHP